MYSLLKVFDIANNQLLTPYPTWFANVFKNCIERDVFAMATNNPWDCTHAREMQVLRVMNIQNDLTSY